MDKRPAPKAPETKVGMVGEPPNSSSESIVPPDSLASRALPDGCNPCLQYILPDRRVLHRPNQS